MNATPGVLAFVCNVCGTLAQCELDRLERETPSCSQCASSPRIRALVAVLIRELTGQNQALPDCPVDKGIRGLGLTDSESYALRLAEKYDYQNTYFHKEPRLDIAGVIDLKRFGRRDFVISSEIFEHIVPPVARAFANVFHILKPGGLFVLTVPYGLQDETLEHFPDLHEYQIERIGDRYILINRTRDGAIQRFENLVFHGGPGATLEMRVFSERDLRRHLHGAGFVDVRIHQESVFRSGIWWPQAWSRPISARRPA